MRIVMTNCNNIYDRCLGENRNRFPQTVFNQDMTLSPSLQWNAVPPPDPSLFLQFGSRSLPSSLSQGQPSGPATFMLSAAGEQRKHDCPDNLKTIAEGIDEEPPHKRTRQTWISSSARMSVLLSTLLILVWNKHNPQSPVDRADRHFWVFMGRQR